jgi:hypothetical protein
MVIPFSTSSRSRCRIAPVALALLFAGTISLCAKAKPFEPATAGRLSTIGSQHDAYMKALVLQGSIVVIPHEELGTDLLHAIAAYD